MPTTAISASLFMELPLAGTCDQCDWSSRVTFVAVALRAETTLLARFVGPMAYTFASMALPEAQYFSTLSHLRGSSRISERAVCSISNDVVAVIGLPVTLEQTENCGVAALKISLVSFLKTFSISVWKLRWAA